MKYDQNLTRPLRMCSIDKKKVIAFHLQRHLYLYLQINIVLLKFYSSTQNQPQIEYIAEQNKP